MTGLYRFFVHHHPAFRLAVREDRPFPAEGAEADWEPTRVRAAADVNDQIYEEVDRAGYSLFKIGFSFAEIPGY